MAERKAFLTTRWQHLAMANYVIAPEVLAPFVPAGTELDNWQGQTYVSLVGLLFLDTRVMGLAVPGHRDFPEVNLRFYVRRQTPEGERRGVVFIKEIVPRPAVAAVARLVYHENYAWMPMRYHVKPLSGDEAEPFEVEYKWQWKGEWNRLCVQTAGPSAPAAPGSEPEFITEHYWGYAAQPDGGCVEYQVEHPAWRVWPVKQAVIECQVGRLYGPRFAEFLVDEPSSAFLADGSEVTVYRGDRI